MPTDCDDGEGPRGHLSTPSSARVSSALLALTGATRRSTSTHTGVGNSLSSTGLVNFGLSDFIDLRFYVLELSTLEPPRINLIPLPNLTHSCFDLLFVTPPPVQTELFDLTSSVLRASIYSACHMTYHSFSFGFFS